ncbi:hypothetical protein [Leifsonia sp. A12D58]|uniref:hypothetical protein n=1 Tax=Leifsonia sp. A12D58 TaxID=3397674 RepID=UPI0039E08C55
MRARIATSVVLAAGILLGTSACNLVAPQATTIHYDPSDGVSATVGNLSVRNALLVSNGDGEATLSATVVNTGDSSHNLNLQYEADSSKVTTTVAVDARSTVVIGSEGGPSVQVSTSDATPGALFPIFVQYGNETGVEMLVPVLDGTLKEYSTLVPTPAPTPAAAPAAVETPAAEATPAVEATPAP